VDDYVNVPVTSSLTPAEITVCTWAKRIGPGDAQTYQGLFIGETWDDSGFNLLLDNEMTQIRWRVLTLNSGSTYDVTASVTTSNWHHYCGSFAGGISRLYVDGAIAASLAAVYDPNSGRTDDFIGLNQTPSTGGFNGLMDDVRVYNRALSADEVKRLYNIGGTVKLNSTQNLNNNNSLQRGLVGWWTFDGKDMAGDISSRRYVFDRSGQGNRGAYWNATGTPPVIGKIGQGLSFDGVDDYVDAGTGSSLDMGIGNFTLSVWFKTSFSQTGELVGKGGAGTGGKRYLLALNDSDCSSAVGMIKAEIDDNTTKKFLCSTGSSFNDGQWHHVVMMKEGNNLRLYEDGKGLTASVDVTGYGNINSTRVFSIGSQYDEDASAQNNFFPGLLDDVRIYNRALSADEVKRLYNMAEIPT
jgi:hypothetical protein